MDQSVIAAMKRWPNVPDVYGWLSLTSRGEWRLHPGGDALVSESITSAQILQFIHRNYSCDATGRWYFQNGPQRVFVTLTVAPFIFHTEDGLRLTAHTGAAAGKVRELWFDNEGKLYARTALGPGLIDGRDTMQLLELLRTRGDEPLLDILDTAETCTLDKVIELSASAFADYGTRAGDASIPLRFCNGAEIPARMGFVLSPASNGLTPKNEVE